MCLSLSRHYGVLQSELRTKLSGIMQSKITPKTLVSLFSGAGGLDLGLEMAGFETVVANEIQEEACETLRKNQFLCGEHSSKIEDFIEQSLKQRCFKAMNEKQRDFFFNRIKSPKKRKYLQAATIIEQDIRTLDTAVLSSLLGEEEPFCVAGGPPCQPFSKAGKQKSLDCTKNGDLFYEFVRVVRSLKPQWFVFENVKGLTFTKTDVAYSSCKKCSHIEILPFEIRQNLSQLDFAVSSCTKCKSVSTELVVKNEPGGSLKIILNEFQKIGYFTDHKVVNAADFGAPQIRERLFIIGSKSKIPFSWPQPTHQKPIAGQGELFDSNEDFCPWVSMKEAIWQRGHPIFGNINQECARLWVKNVVRPHDEPVTWDLNRPAPTIGAHQGAKLAFAPNGIPKEQLFRQQWHTKGRRQSDTPPVNVVHEYLSDEELLLLQTFPRWWYLHGTRMQRAFQIGNAVPPILGKVIGKAILEATKNAKN